MIINRKNLGAGLVFVALGLFFALQSLLRLRIGSALNMGPGYFPLVLGGILVALGVAIAVTGLRLPNEEQLPVPWRGLLLVFGSIVFFAVTVRGLGFMLALTGSSVMATLSTGRLGLLGTLLLSVAIAAFGTAVFVYGLKLPYPVVGPWLVR